MKVVVRGRVQGVGFRAAAAYEARRLGLDGWVRNLLDGQVEVQARGDDQSVDALCAWLATGPRGARVTGVDRQEISTSAEDEDLEGFTIR